MLLKTTQQLESRLQALVFIACLGEEEGVFDLFRFVPSQFEQDLIESARELLAIPKRERNRLITKELKRLLQMEGKRVLGEIHPGWFYDRLKEERSSIVRLILKYLPENDVKHVLRLFPLEMRKKISEAKISKRLSETVVELIRRRFESNFLTLIPPRAELITYDYFYFIKLDQLLLFFRELGMDQLAKAFKALAPEALKAFIHRLLVSDTKEFLSRMKSIDKISKHELREAQMLLLHIPLESIEPKELFLEVGVAFFARGIKKEGKEFVKALGFKLPPKLGYLLKRYFEEGRVAVKQNTREWIEKQVLEHFQSFAVH